MPKDWLSRLLDIPLSERAVVALEKIADALDRAFPPGQREGGEPPSGNLIDSNPDEVAWKEEQATIQRDRAPLDPEEMLEPSSPPRDGSDA